MDNTLPLGACQQSHQYIEHGLQGSYSQEVEWRSTQCGLTKHRGSKAC